MRAPRALGAVEATRRGALIVGGAIVAGALLRFPFLGHQSFWLDESYTARIVRDHSLIDVWSGVKATESTPPLYYLLTWAWTSLIGSHSEAAIRATSAMAGVACVPASFLAARKLAGRRVAYAVSWLCATSPVLVWYSLDARSYELMVLVSMLSVWAFALLLERPSRRRWAGWALVGAVCLWTHYFCVFLLLAELFVLAWKRPASRRAAGIWSVAVVALAAPVLTVFLEQRGDTERTVWIAGRSLSGRVEQTVREFAMGPNVPHAALEGAGLVLAGAALVAGAILAVRMRRARQGPLAALVLALIGVGLPLALAGAGIDDHFLVRNLLVVWLAVAIVAALALTHLRAMGLVIYLCLCTATIIWIESNWRYQITDWRGASRELSARASGDPVILYPSLQWPLATLYLNRTLAAQPVRTREVWAVVEPARQGARELTPVSGAPPPTVPGPPFRQAELIEHRGFRLVRFNSPKPIPIDPAAIQGYPVRGFPPFLLAP